ncbi:sensor histidine kinase [Geomesophilobacter sediminis]|uniref:histidine kinase n=1 Tax=Geomesophilobacter sediminis TaxID=2798584 RepID=A0A8J7M0A6_9BACT|nr:ATP-binding protein [Geomesophilobacter sediminis]MBJ6724182.1 PAS domain S-box protein [Geomesophilobacter sediminis]
MTTGKQDNHERHQHSLPSADSTFEVSLKRFRNDSLVRTLLESLAEGVVIIDRSRTIVLANAQAEKMFGYESNELIGKPHVVLVPEHFRTRHQEHEAGYFNEPKIRPMGLNLELSGARKDGTEFPVEISLSFIHSVDGLLVMAFISDISVRKRAEEGMKAANAELARSNKELDLFASVVSHDLQEPLKTITSYTELLALKYRERLDQQADIYMKFMLESTEHMKVMITDLLTYSRLGTRAKPFGPVLMGGVVDLALESLTQSLQEAGAEIEREELPEVAGDQMQLLQLIQNLIGNAIKFRKKETPVRIRISAQRQGNDWLFGVHDNGIGIAPRFSIEIFDVFRRLHTRQEYQGSGIGLAICRKVVERHGGRIWVESAPGEGSSFFFSLPAIGAYDGTR